jgi:hypothetical protein
MEGTDMADTTAEEHMNTQRLNDNQQRGFKMTDRDISGDGAADLMVVASDGFLYYYPNNSKSNPGHAPFTNAEWKSPGPTWGQSRLA